MGIPPEVADSSLPWLAGRAHRERSGNEARRRYRHHARIRPSRFVIRQHKSAEAPQQIHGERDGPTITPIAARMADAMLREQDLIVEAEGGRIM